MAQMLERVAIARRRGIQRDGESFTDLLKGEAAPNLQHDDFAIDRRKRLHGANQVRIERFCLGERRRFGRTEGEPWAFSGIRFAARSSIDPAGEIDRAAADRCKHECIRGRPAVAVALPRLDECLLKDVVGIRLAACLIPGKEQERAPAGFEPVAPGLRR